MTDEDIIRVASALLHILLRNNQVGLDVLTVDDIIPLKDLMHHAWELSQTEVRNDVLSMCLAGLSALGKKNNDNEKIEWIEEWSKRQLKNAKSKGTCYMPAYRWKMPKEYADRVVAWRFFKEGENPNQYM